MGVELAPKPEWATLPIACVIVGLTVITVPSIFLMKIWGRKNGSLIGLALLVISSVICAYASYHSSFVLLMIGATLLGAGSAVLQQFRFAAIESLDNQADIGPALSLLLLGGAVAAFIGPELASYGRIFSASGQGYTGSFILLAFLNLAAMALFNQFKNPVIEDQPSDKPKRTIFKIILQPSFLTAAALAAVGFAVMSFLMTSTPVTMNHFHGHSVEDAKWVIQSHMLAMFLPSLFSGLLIKRFGPAIIVFSGALLYALVLIIASMGHELLHFWWALVLLGIGWNFLFVGGTTLLPQSYNHTERFSAQAANDFIVLSLQATASLTAGWVLFRYGWTMQLMICIPFVFLAFILSAIVLFSKKSA